MSRRVSFRAADKLRAAIVGQAVPRPAGITDRDPHRRGADNVTDR
jgi:hypothetical protein